MAVPLTLFNSIYFHVFLSNELFLFIFNHIEDEPSYNKQFDKNFPYLRARHGKLLASNFKVLEALDTFLPAFYKIDLINCHL